MHKKSNIILVLAITALIASILVSCGGRLKQTSGSVSDKPLQRVLDMFAVESDNGRINMRIEARIMEHYENDSLVWDYFPDGLSVFSYNEDGLLESIVISDEAKHISPKKSTGSELWSAYGNVVIHNVIKLETMETDTIYWDQTSKEIYTDCYVKLYSPDVFMQGYGMRSDDHARNAILYRPFSGYGLVVKDTTALVIDSVNFIGPFPEKITKFAAPVE